jgi:hypothetical protein
MKSISNKNCKRMREERTLRRYVKVYVKMDLQTIYECSFFVTVYQYDDFVVQM